ncbi:hypothetical protein C8J56DRAFT_895452 [Mycena floridula]|nr:hypothetical protein C8J56DRAFT_895452 [Mycena floridula]
MVAHILSEGQDGIDGLEVREDGALSRGGDIKDANVLFKPDSEHADTESRNKPEPQVEEMGQGKRGKKASTWHNIDWPSKARKSPKITHVTNLYEPSSESAVMRDEFAFLSVNLAFLHSVTCYDPRRGWFALTPKYIGLPFRAYGNRAIRASSSDTLRIKVEGSKGSMRRSTVSVGDLFHSKVHLGPWRISKLRRVVANFAASDGPRQTDNAGEPQDVVASGIERGSFRSGASADLISLAGGTRRLGSDGRHIARLTGFVQLLTGSITIERQLPCNTGELVANPSLRRSYFGLLLFQPRLAYYLRFAFGTGIIRTVVHGLSSVGLQLFRRTCKSRFLYQ